MNPLTNKAKAFAKLSDIAIDAGDDGFLYFQEISKVLNPDYMELNMIVTGDMDIIIDTSFSVTQAIVKFLKKEPYMNYKLTENGTILILGKLSIEAIANKYNPKNKFQQELLNEYIAELKIAAEIEDTDLDIKPE